MWAFITFNYPNLSKKGINDMNMNPSAIQRQPKINLSNFFLHFVFLFKIGIFRNAFLINFFFSKLASKCMTICSEQTICPGVLIKVSFFEKQFEFKQG